MRPIHNPQYRDPPSGDARFDWMVALLAALPVAGMYTDGWAHLHLDNIETFFTPWHAVLYSGLVAVASFLVLCYGRNLRLGHHWLRAMPPGYNLSLLGIVVFTVGGIGDLIWHEIFGIEQSLDALISPTHLIIIGGAVLIVTGPLRARWHQIGLRSEEIARSRLPAVISLLTLFCVLTFCTEYSSQITTPTPAMSYLFATTTATFVYQALGVSGIILQSAIMMGIILLGVRTSVLWPGTVTLVLVVNTVGMAILSFALPGGAFPYVLVAAGTGIVADLMLRYLQPSAARPTMFRIFAFATPALFYTGYFILLQVTGGIWWSVHYWVGSIALAGFAGQFLSYAFVPASILTQAYGDPSAPVIGEQVPLPEREELSIP